MMKVRAETSGKDVASGRFKYQREVFVLTLVLIYFMNKSQFNKTIPIHISRQISDSSVSNLLTETHPSPKLSPSQSLLRLNMRKNSWRQSSSTMKSCLQDLKWIFEQSEEFLRHLMNKEPIKPYKMRFDNLIKELKSLEMRFQSINMSDIIDFVNKQDSISEPDVERKFFKPSSRRQPKIDIGSEITLPLNYNLSMDTKTQKNLRNKSQNPSQRVSNKQNSNYFQSLKSQKNGFMQLLVVQKRSESKAIDNIKSTIQRLRESASKNICQNQVEGVNKIVDYFLEYQKEVNRVIQSVGESKRATHIELELENSKLLLKLQEMKLENQLLSASRPLPNIKPPVPTPFDNNPSYSMLLMQAQVIEQLMG